MGNEKLFPRPDIAFPHGQALSIRANIDVPGRDLFGQRGAAEAQLAPALAALARGAIRRRLLRV
jgi:hypothetical protein